jgi:hypothetical protein
VIAYADDVTVFITRVGEFVFLKGAIQAFERATGAWLNPRKSQAMANGVWTEIPTPLGIQFKENFNILGVYFKHTLALSVTETWTKFTNGVREQARRAYGRQLCLAQRVQYVHHYLLAKIWNVA